MRFIWAAIKIIIILGLLVGSVLFVGFLVNFIVRFS